MISGFDRKVRVIEWKEKSVNVRRSYVEHSKRINSLDIQEGRILSTGDEGKLIVRNYKE